MIKQLQLITGFMGSPNHNSQMRTVQLSSKNNQKEKMMNKLHIGFIALAIMSVINTQALAHDITLHTTDKWDECALQIDPSLTQSAWKQFNSEMGEILTFRPVTSAKPLGKGNFDIVLTKGWAPVVDTDAAWNDTFVHPHSSHWLYGEYAEEEGETTSGHGDSPHSLGLPIPLVRVGITDRIDIGATYIMAPGSNYGFLGTQVQYNLVNDTEKGVAGSVRGSMMLLVGIDDLKSAAYTIDALGSKDIAMFTGYGGIQANLLTSKETTSVVDLKNETKLGLQAFVGVNTTLFSHLKVGAEVSFGTLVIPAIVLGYSR